MGSKVTWEARPGPVVNIKVIYISLNAVCWWHLWCTLATITVRNVLMHLCSHACVWLTSLLSGLSACLCVCVRQVEYWQALTIINIVCFLIFRTTVSTHTNTLVTTYGLFLVDVCPISYNRWTVENINVAPRHVDPCADAVPRVHLYFNPPFITLRATNRPVDVRKGLLLCLNPPSLSGAAQWPLIAIVGGSWSSLFTHTHSYFILSVNHSPFSHSRYLYRVTFTVGRCSSHTYCSTVTPASASCNHCCSTVTQSSVL